MKVAKSGSDTIFSRLSLFSSAQKFCFLGRSLPWEYHNPLSDQWITLVTPSPLVHTVASPHGPCNTFVTSMGLGPPT